MILNELFDRNDKADVTWNEVVTHLVKEYSLEKFQGNQATVITTPDKNHVYRIWTKDAGFEKWLDYVMKNQGNKFLPKVVGKPRVINAKFRRLPKDVKVKFVKLEKLTACSHVLGDLIENFNSEEIDSKTYEEHIETFIDRLDQRAKAELEKREEFFRFAFEIAEKFFVDDFSDENIMMRGDTPVITDPISYV